MFTVLQLICRQLQIYTLGTLCDEAGPGPTLMEPVCCGETDSYCDPMDCSLPGSSVHGILQARILEWVAIPFSRVSKSASL